MFTFHVIEKPLAQKHFSVNFPSNLGTGFKIIKRPCHGQGDQIGRNFAVWAVIFNLQFFLITAVAHIFVPLFPR
jgi:hypothetical protein